MGRPYTYDLGVLQWLPARAWEPGSPCMAPAKTILAPEPLGCALTFANQAKHCNFSMDEGNFQR